MMLSERNYTNPTVHIPPWSLIHDDPTADIPLLDSNSYVDYSPFSLSSLHRFLPSNDVDAADPDAEISALWDLDVPLDAFTSDEFRMFEFKVRKCMRGKSHDWTECPYAHPGEKARRRDPRKYSYSGSACPDYRKGSCKKGEGCEYAHGVFECWLHPSRYRTQPCKDGVNCRRRVCFFAHTSDQLRVATQPSPTAVNQPDSPFRNSISPPGTPSAESPPLSPMTRSLGALSRSPNSVSELVNSLRQLQLGKVMSFPPGRNVQPGCSSGFGSPRGSVLRPGFYSLPNTPTGSTRRGTAFPEMLEEEPAMERVESGRDLRVKMFEKLRNENSLGRADPDQSTGSGPDVGWVSDLIN